MIEYLENEKVKILLQLNQELEDECQRREESEYRRRLQEASVSPNMKVNRPNFRFDPKLEEKQEQLCTEIIVELRKRFPDNFKKIEIDFPADILNKIGNRYWANIDILMPDLQNICRSLISLHHLQAYDILVLKDKSQKLTQTIFIHPNHIEGQPEDNGTWKLPRNALKFFSSFGLPDWAVYDLYCK